SDLVKVSRNGNGSVPHNICCSLAEGKSYGIVLKLVSRPVCAWEQKWWSFRPAPVSGFHLVSPVSGSFHPISWHVVSFFVSRVANGHESRNGREDTGANQ